MQEDTFSLGYNMMVDVMDSTLMHVNDLPILIPIPIPIPIPIHQRGLLTFAINHRVEIAFLFISFNV